MRLVLLDLEFENQSTRERDIIQIGAVEVDLVTGEILPFFNEFVALPQGEVLSTFISRLTGISKDEVASARSAEEVFRDFWKAFRRADVDGNLSAWGDDAEWIRQESRRHGVRIPTKVTDIDIKKMFQFFRLQRGLGTREKTGLINTLEAFDLGFEGRHHNAYDDAYNTARLLLQALRSPDPQDP